MTEENKNSVEETVEDVKENDIPAEDTESVEDQTTETPAGEETVCDSRRRDKRKKILWKEKREKR